MRKSTKIMLVAALAILLCAFLLLGALFLEDGSRDEGENQMETDRERAGEERQDEAGEKDDEERTMPGEEISSASGTAETAPLAIEILLIAAEDYPTVNLYCQIYYEGSGEFASGLPLDIFEIMEVPEVGETDSCELLSAAQLTAAGSPVKQDCYLLTCRAPGGALESGVEFCIRVDSERYTGEAGASLAQIVPEQQKPDDRYLVVKEDVTWEEAVKLCEEAGGHLVDINSEEEYQQVTALAEAAGLKVFWAGARIERITDDWDDAKWITGAPMDFTDWYPGEPNKETDDEFCLMVFCVDGVWAFNDAPNDSNQYYLGRIGYICELD